MRSLAACAMALALAFTAPVANADSPRVRATNPAWKSECGSCHVAYPPGLLPAEAWRRLIARLDRHFGTDASLEPAAAREIGGFLEQNAARRHVAIAGAGEPRITDTLWFHREHREVEPSAWSRPNVKSAANCGACHTDADSGGYRKRAIRMPR